MTKVCLQNMGQIVDIYLLGELDGVVQNQIHEGVKSTEGSFNLSTTINAQVDTFVHKLLKLWRMCF